MLANISSLTAELLARPRPVTIGLAGAGQMGTDMIVQIGLMPGLRLGAVSDVNTAKIATAARMAGLSEDDVVEANSAAAIDSAIERGKLALAGDLSALASAGLIDVVIDATGNPNIGSALALDAIAHGKHVIMLNVEADITIGRFLKAEADKAGVIYSGAAGDEPACTLELIGFAQSLGLKIICAGKGKNNPLNFNAVPADYQEEARARNMNARMLVEFVDGSKTMIEMTAIANCTGLVPDVPGMHGPSATREELASVLCPKDQGGILSGPGRVDYSIGKGVAPGVFCIVEPTHPRLLERMVDLKVGKGPCFALMRPFHLTSLEVPLSAARAVLHRQADMVPLDRPVAECVTLAKRDLQPGEIMGRIGEADYRAWAMTWEDARRASGVPLGLAERAKIIKPVKAGQMLTYDNCVPDDTLVITQIRKRLDQADARFVQAA